MRAIAKYRCFRCDLLTARALRVDVDVPPDNCQGRDLHCNVGPWLAAAVHLYIICFVVIAAQYMYDARHIVRNDDVSAVSWW